MSNVDPELVEKYQLMHQKDPESKVFAPLAEAYRKMGLLDQAHKVAFDGVKIYPDFVSGRVALGRCLIAMNENYKAIPQLKKATELAPENILAQSLLAEAYIKESKLQDALKCYKVLLFLNPQNKNAQSAVKKLESLTAADYSENDFQLKEFSKTKSDKTLESKTKEITNYDTHRALSLADAYYARSEPQKAIDCLEKAIKELGPLNELIERKNWFSNQNHEEPASTELTTEAEDSSAKKKIIFLKQVLYNIQENKK